MSEGWEENEAMNIIALSDHDKLLTSRAQAYQVIGALLDRCGLFDHEEGIRALDYFAYEDVREDFLWGNDLPTPEQTWSDVTKKADQSYWTGVAVGGFAGAVTVAMAVIISLLF